MTDSPLLLELSKGVLTLTLNRPERLNAFVPTMHEALAAAFARAEGEAAIRAVLVTGAGRGFCAGQDLQERKFAPGERPRDLGAGLDRYYNPLIRRIRALEKPVVAAVNGVAAGAGMSLALACDIVIAARSASFIQAFSRIGLVPDAGSTWFLPRLAGSARALGLALTGEALPAEQAAAWGLIWRCVADDALMTEARALAQRLAQGPTKGLGLIKRALNRSARNDLDTQLDLERDTQREAGRSEDYREGITAFLEKRAPQFKGV
ncbi:MAG TPA: 2-(1,2-epoxy-1,2-dihydrophenyl)acetyl-CoA isomerase PaaG [Stellaceae bacterium]|nr:2-(1,2-epoxy-1,2-dihydrophenyl)acetyl-CoA isomerase PaaG [Stellaceae bacterium]